jgi:copper resistance protein C
MRHSSLVGIIPLLLLFASGEAAAHAFFDHAEPRVGNKVASAPREVTLWFTQKLEPVFSVP